MTITYSPMTGLFVNGAQGEGHYAAMMALLRGLDLMVGVVKSATTVAQPGSPADGDMYITPATATGASWASNQKKVARYSSVAVAWEYFTPKTGWRFTAQDSGIVYRYNGTSTLWEAQSGVYTPTLTNVTNINSSTAYDCQYSRNGNIVTVSGKARFNAVGAGAAELGISLPIASDFANDYECCGTGASDLVADGPLFIKADVTNNRAALMSTQNGTTAHDHFFHFTYRII